MDAATLFRGFMAGILATFAMLPVELMAFRRWGLRGVFEWHEVHASLFGFQSHRPFDAVGFAGHLVFGGVGGIVLALGLWLLRLPAYPSAIALGIALWVGTLLLHELPTAVHPLRNPMGMGPAIASFVGHLAYGVALGSVASYLLP